MLSHRSQHGHPIGVPVLTAPCFIQVTANAPGKAAGDGTAASVLVPMGEETEEASGT